MGFYIHYSVTFSGDVEHIPRLRSLISDFKYDPDEREVEWFLKALVDEKNYNCGPKGELFTWGVVGNYTNVERVVELLSPLLERMLRLEVSVFNFDHIIFFEEREQSEQAVAYEVFLDADNHFEYTVKKHRLPFCWGQM